MRRGSSCTGGRKPPRFACPSGPISDWRASGRKNSQWPSGGTASPSAARGSSRSSVAASRSSGPAVTGRGSPRSGRSRPNSRIGRAAFSHRVRPPRSGSSCAPCHSASRPISGEQVETGGQGDEMIAGKLAHLAREMDAAIGEQDFGLRNAAGIEEESGPARDSSYGSRSRRRSRDRRAGSTRLHRSSVHARPCFRRAGGRQRRRRFAAPFRFPGARRKPCPRS